MIGGKNSKGRFFLTSSLSVSLSSFSRCKMSPKKRRENKKTEMTIKNVTIIIHFAQRRIQNEYYLFFSVKRGLDEILSFCVIFI